MPVKRLVSSLLLSLLAIAAPAIAADFTDPATGMEFVLVKGGCFVPDQPATVAESDSQSPVEETCINDFYMGRYEVTQAQYLKIVGKASTFKGLCPDCPVVNITHDDAEKFLAQLSRESQLAYRLPYEDEWEFAATGRNAGQQWPGTSEAGKLVDYAWYAANSGNQYQPVGQKRPTRQGIHDLAGNVAEWCADVYYERPGNSQSQPDLVLRHSVRGGSYRDDPERLKAKARGYLKPIVRPAHKATNGTYDVDLGFRVVLPAERLRFKSLYRDLASGSAAQVAPSVRKLKSKTLSPRGQGELILAALDLLPEQNLSAEIAALIKQGADVNVRNAAGNTPLLVLYERMLGHLWGDSAEKVHTGADNLACKLASLLVEAGADVNARDASGRTALTLAAELGARKSVQLLVEAGADVNLVDRQSQTPLMHACKSRYQYVSNSAEAGSGWDEDILVAGIRKKYEQIAKLLGSAGADPGIKDASGKTAIDYARESGSENLVKYVARSKS